MAEKAVSEMTDEEIIIHIRSLREQRERRTAEAIAAKEKKVREPATPKQPKDTIDEAFGDVLKELLGE